MTKWCVSIIAQFDEKDKLADVAFQDLIDSILNLENTGNVNYFIFKYYKETKFAEIFEIQFNTAPPHSLAKKDRMDASNFFDEDSKLLIDFFNYYSLKEDFECHILLTWGHGAGFGFFAQGELPEGHSLGNEIRGISYINYLLANGVLGYDINLIADQFSQFLENFHEIRISDKFLLNKRLSEAFKIIPTTVINKILEETFKKKNKVIQIMYTMNCFMQMFETGYLLSPNVNYLIGAETFQFFFGPDYSKLFSKLAQTSNTEADIKSLLESIVKNYEERYKDKVIMQKLKKYSDRSYDPAVYIKFLSLSVNNLTKYQNARKKIDAIADYFFNNRSIYKLIRVVRDQCQNVTSGAYGIIDPIYFFKLLFKEHSINSDLKKLLGDLIDYITKTDEIIVAKYPNSSITSLCKPKRVGQYLAAICPQGFSIFFPKDHERSISDEYVKFFMNLYKNVNHYKKLENQFLIDSSWDRFVIDYYDYVF
jgi:hypothetical protein